MKKFYYHINLNERGEFNADVRNEREETIFSIDGFDIFEDGFMKHSQDMSGLEEYLIELGYIPEDSSLIYVR